MLCSQVWGLNQDACLILSIPTWSLNTSGQVQTSFWQLNLRELQTKLPVFLKPKPKHTSWLSLHSLIKASQKGSTDSEPKKTDLPLDWKKNINVQQWEEFLTTIFRNGLPSVPIAPQFSSVTQSCPTLCDPIDCSTPGLPVHHQLLELAQTHVHRVSDAIQPSHPLSSPSPAFNLSQHQGLFKWVSSLHEAAKVLDFQLQYQSF